MLRNAAHFFSATFFKGRGFQSQILHVTDTEGTPFALNTFRNSALLKINSDNGLQFKSTVGIPHLIYGGDATDRGRHDLETMEMLVDFKKRYPQQVHLLVGNREIKQTRFSIELAAETIRERLLKTPQPYWISQPTTPMDYVKTAMRTAGMIDPGSDAIEQFINQLSVEKCQLLYLHWMLEKTMGCPHTFRFRREELVEKFKRPIPDEDVLRNFLKETSPTGLMGEYLQLADVGVILPNTGVMAVHGGLTSNNIGRVPDMQPGAAPIQNAYEWIAALNRWYHKEIESWVQRVNAEVRPFHPPGNTLLDQSVLPVPGKQKYVMTSDMLGPQRQFAGVPVDVDDYVTKNNLKVVLTGHQPIGDHPCILRSEKVLFINGDTGYAAGPKNPDNTRGNANHILEMTADKKKVDVKSRASLIDNTRVETQLCVSREGVLGDKYIGKVLEDNQLVQCRLPNGEYRVAQQKGFDVSYDTVPADKLMQQKGVAKSSR